MVTEAEFRTAILPFTLHEEGGLSTDPHDDGNWTGGAVGKGVLRGTKFGISAKAHPTLDIRHLSVEQASDLYWADYCHSAGFDRLSAPLCLTVFDGGVQCGQARARAWLAGVAHLGGEADQIRAFSAANLAYHKRLKTWSRYGAVWQGRIERCEAQALKLLAVAPQLATPRVPAPRSSAPRPAPRASEQPLSHPFLTWLVKTLLTSTQPAKA